MKKKTLKLKIGQRVVITRCIKRNGSLAEFKDHTGEHGTYGFPGDKLVYSCPCTIDGGKYHVWTDSKEWCCAAEVDELPLNTGKGGEK